MNLLSRSAIFALVVVALASAGTYAQSTRIPADLEITLQRTMCYGTCPDYTLTITADRKVVFHGGQFTKVKGTARSRISRSSLKEIVAEIKRIDLASFGDDYSQGGFCEGYVTDLPSEIISVRMNGKTKKINHYFGCMGKAVGEKLKPLTALGKTIDRLTNSQQWVVK